ncbi:MAG: hypothetical protein IT371_07320 [Deltaproteobacteria bacterium]|nr:hypothetical protein [Deltaproteobacteria bacterium]
MSSRSLRALLFLVPLSALSAGFTPFSPITSVCPKCPAPNEDVVVLLSGVRVPCRVVAHNRSYYILERLGEVRAVKKREVGQVVWRGSEQPVLQTADQVILKNGVVLHGSIVEEEKARFFVVQSGSRRLVAWVSQIAAVYKQGEAYRFKNSEPTAQPSP